jgi:hypothetical protein
VRVQDGFDWLLFGRVNKSAGVNNHYVSVICVRGHLHSVRQDVAEHNLGINQVFRAAEADHPHLDGG